MSIEGPSWVVHITRLFGATLTCDDGTQRSQGPTNHMNIVPLFQLRDRRLKIGLTQTELGALLGTADASVVSKHESGLRLPDLRTAIAYHVVLSSRIDQLFPDLVEEVTADIAARATSLAIKLRSQGVDQRVAAVLHRLSEIAGDDIIEYGDDTLF